MWRPACHLNCHFQKPTAHRQAERRASCSRLLNFNRQKSCARQVFLFRSRVHKAATNQELAARIDAKSTVIRCQLAGSAYGTPSRDAQQIAYFATACATSLHYMATSLSPLHMVLATLPVSNSEGLDLSREVALVRSAVLYADTIDLISPAGSILSTVDGLQAADAGLMSEYINSLTDE